MRVASSWSFLEFGCGEAQRSSLQRVGAWGACQHRNGPHPSVAMGDYPRGKASFPLFLRHTRTNSTDPTHRMGGRKGSGRQGRMDGMAEDARGPDGRGRRRRQSLKLTSQDCGSVSAPKMVGPTNMPVSPRERAAAPEACGCSCFDSFAIVAPIIRLRSLVDTLHQCPRDNRTRLHDTWRNRTRATRCTSSSSRVVPSITDSLIQGTEPGLTRLDQRYRATNVDPS